MGAPRQDGRGWITGLLAALRDLVRLPRRADVLADQVSAATTELHALRDEVVALRADLDGLATAAESGARLAELRDSVHLVARRTALRRRPVRVLFLVHVLGTWDSYHALVAAMRADDDFDPVVASIPRRFRGSHGLYGEEEVHRGLAAR